VQHCAAILATAELLSNSVTVTALLHSSNSCSYHRSLLSREMNITSINASSSLVIIITCHHHHCHHHHLSSSSLVIIITCHHHHCHHHHCHHHVRLFDKLTKRNLNIKSNNSWRRLIINRESKWSKGRYTLPVALHDNAFSNRARKHGPCSDACPDYPCWCLKWQPCSRLTFLTPVNAGACPHYPWTEHGCHFRHPSSRPVNMGSVYRPKQARPRRRTVFLTEQ